MGIAKRTMRFILGLTCALPLHVVVAMPDGVIGYVKTATPDAAVTSDGQAVAARPGVPLRRGSVLSTGRSGSVGVTLSDNTIISIGTDSEIRVDEYRYEPVRGERRLEATLVRGTLYFVSGVLARLNPEAVVIHTPTGAIDVRGSRFLVRVDGADSAPAPRREGAPE